MSEARTFSWWYGKGRHALLYDLMMVQITFPPRSMEDIEANIEMLPRLIYPKIMMQNIKDKEV